MSINFIDREAAKLILGTDYQESDCRNTLSDKVSEKISDPTLVFDKMGIAFALLSRQEAIDDLCEYRYESIKGEDGCGFSSEESFKKLFATGLTGYNDYSNDDLAAAWLEEIHGEMHSDLLIVK